MHLVTGYAGEEHITAQNIGRFQGILTEDKTMRWDGLDVNIVSNNVMSVTAGYGIIEGRIFNNQFDEELVLGGVPVGMYERDLIVVRYQKDANTNIETVELVAIEGTQATRSTSAEIPEYNEGSISAGDAVVDFPIAELLRDYQSVSINQGKWCPEFDDTYIDEAYITERWSRYGVTYGGGRRY